MRIAAPFILTVLASSQALAQAVPADINPDDQRDVQQQEVERTNGTLPVISVARVDEAIQIRLEGSELVIKTGLRETETKNKLDIHGYGGFTTLFIQNKNGNGVTEARNLQFDHWDFAVPGAILVKTSVSSSPGNVNISRFTETLGTDSSVQLIQNSRAEDVEHFISFYVQKSVNATNRTIVNLRLSARSLEELRRLYPRETTEYLQPIFRDLQQEAAVFSIDPKVAWQVFAGAYKADDRDKAKVAQVVAKLDTDSFQERQKASSALQEMGEPAAMILSRQDRSKFSAEQNSRIDAFLASYLPLPESEAAALREKPDFLLDCLYTADSFVRTQALAQLEKITGKPIEFDHHLEGDARFDAVAKLRAQLKLGPATQPTTRSNPN